MEERKFTVEDGIKIQTQHLEQWKSVLIPEVYSSLEEYAIRKNHEAKDGFDITRGQMLSSYISNYMLGHRF